jgi:hypothetical protein
MDTYAFVAAALLAAVHASGQHLRALDSHFGIRFAQVAEGCLLAYVVVDLLPVVAQAESRLNASEEARWFVLTEPAWLACLGGMLLLTIAQGSRRKRGRATTNGAEPEGVDPAFVLTTAAHVAANLNAGILLQHHHHRGALALVPVTLLLGVHLALVEREHLLDNAEAYRRWGRPAMAAALLAGAVIGTAWTPDGVVLAMLRSALAGLLALNVLQHHVREQDVSRAPGFVLGGILYGLALAIV